MIVETSLIYTFTNQVSRRIPQYRTCIAQMAPPSCELATDERTHMVQTFVVKLSGSAEGLGRIRDLLIVDGRHPGAYAAVKLDEFNSDPGIFS